MSGLDIVEIIVVVKHDGCFRWYKSDRDLWVLDWHKWTKESRDAGFQVPESDPAERFGISIVNNETAAKFLAAMEQFRISADDLATELVARFPGAQSWWDVGDLFPILFVDFDRKHVCGFYPEGTRLERYIPDGWTSEFEDFQTKYPEERFPRSAKFWIRNGLDMLNELNERGRRISQ
jgi:hypothetical protein